MRARIASLADIRAVRYLLASVAALAVDLGCFLALLSLGAGATAASAIGYSLGIVAHWLFSSRAVFADSVAAQGAERTRQKSLFVISALIGLASTTAVVAAATGIGLDPRIAKLGAIGVSFTITWLLREKLVFRAPARA